MSPFEVRAPGKVVLVGEYAVLDGAPAVVAAVDRGVRCAVSPSPTLRISAPGDDRFVRAALHGAPPAAYAFDDWNPVDLPSKPGLGGSAAATVAAVLAASEVEGAPLGPDDLRLRATEIHLSVQGSGSGIDVAASAHGGVLRFEGDRVEPLAPVDPVVVWSGRSASTGPRVERYLTWSGRQRFAEASAAVVGAFTQDPVEALRAATQLLRRMTRDAGIDWSTPELERIEALAAAVGGAAKPSGAGGGDVAVALFDDPDARARFERDCAEAGLTVIPVRLAAGAAIRR